MDTWSVPASSSDYRRKSVGIKEFADPPPRDFSRYERHNSHLSDVNYVKESPIPIKDCTTKEYQKDNRIGDNGETEKRIQARLSSGTSCRV
jgi:hypothetical protein